MAEVVLFHHVQGLTEGVRAFAEELRAAGTPCIRRTCSTARDRRPSTRASRWPRRIGDEVLGGRANRAVADLPEGLVYAGFSFGAGGAAAGPDPARRARRAALRVVHPDHRRLGLRAVARGVPVQIHGMDKDPFFALEGDIDAARELVETVGSELAELFVYPGDQHLFTDSSLPRTTRTPRRSSCSGRGSSSTGLADSRLRSGVCHDQVRHLPGCGHSARLRIEPRSARSTGSLAPALIRSQVLSLLYRAVHRGELTEGRCAPATTCARAADPTARRPGPPEARLEGRRPARVARHV